MLQQWPSGAALSKLMVVSQGDVKCNWWRGWRCMVVAMIMDGVVVEIREMEAVSGNGCRTTVEVKGKMREKSRHSGPIWVRDCVVRTLSRRS